MALPVRLRDVVEAMDAPVDGWMAYINRRTGEIISFSDDDDDILPDWQAEIVAKVKEVEASDDFVQLPDKFDVHEYAIMESFCYTVDDDTLRQDFLETIKGSGAFRHFKGMIRRRGLEQAWWTYRDAAFEKIATNFLEMEGLAFEDK